MFRLADGSGFMVAELTDPGEHPLRQQATVCVECGEKCVMFNPGNVDVSCHSCGTREPDMEARQFHLMVWYNSA